MNDDLTARACEAISASALSDFTSSHAWAHWCHDVAQAALDGDADKVDALTNPQLVDG